MIYYIVYEMRGEKGWKILETDYDLYDHKDLEKFIIWFNDKYGDCVITFWRRLY